MRKRTLIIIAAGILLVLGGYSIYWLYVADRIAEGIGKWAEAQRSRGFQISFGEPRITGYPLAFDASFDHPVVVAPGGAWQWTGPTLFAHADSWDLTRVEARFPGRHAVSWKDVRGTRSAVAETAEAGLQLDFGVNRRIQQGRINLGQLLLRPDIGGSMAVRSAVGSLRSLPSPSGAPNAIGDLGFDVVVEEVTLPAPIPPLGAKIDRVAVAGEVLGPIPPGPPRESLATWRDASGTVELRRLEAVWGDLKLRGDGTFALDAAMQPEGAMSATVSGHMALVDALIKRGVIPSGQGRLVRIAMNALSRVPTGGGAAEMKIPLTIQEQTVTVGPFLGFAAIPIAKLPHIEWE